MEKALREYPDTPSSNQMREYLKLINQNMLSHWYDLYVADDTYVLMQKEIATRRARNKQDKDKLQPVNLSKRTLRRVFGRGSFERGGRFYGAILIHLNLQTLIHHQYNHGCQYLVFGPV